MQFNPQTFSGLVALTFLSSLATLFNSIYYVTISFGNWAMFYGGGLSYVASVTGLFYLLCERADALSKAVSEAIDHLFICLILGISKLDLLVSWEQTGCPFWNLTAFH